MEDYGRLRSGNWGQILQLKVPWGSKVEKYMVRKGIRGLWLDYSEDWHEDNFEFLKTIDWLEELVVFFHGYYVITHFGPNGLYSGMDIVRASKPMDLTPISTLTSLKRLQLSVFGKPKLDFSRLTSLEECWVDWSPGYQGLLELGSLKRLGINSTPAKLIPQICRLSGLEDLSLMACGATSVDCLADLKNLRELDLVGFRKLSSIDFLRHLKGLRVLQLRGCRGCSSLDVLSALEELEELVLDDLGDVETLLPLVTLKKLRRITVMGRTKLADRNVAPVANALPLLEHFSV